MGRKDASKLEQANKRFEEYKENMRVQSEQKDTLISKYDKKAKLLEAEILNYQRQCSDRKELQKTIMSVQGENEILRKALNELKTAYSEKKNELINMKDKSKSIQVKIEELRKAEVDLRNEHNASHAGKTKLEEKCAFLEAQLNEYRLEVNDRVIH